VTEVKHAAAPATVTSMALFDRLADAGIVTLTGTAEEGVAGGGYIRKRLGEQQRRISIPTQVQGKMDWALE